MSPAQREEPWGAVIVFLPPAYHGKKPYVCSSVLFWSMQAALTLELLAGPEEARGHCVHPSPWAWFISPAWLGNWFCSELSNPTAHSSCHVHPALSPDYLLCFRHRCYPVLTRLTKMRTNIFQQVSAVGSLLALLRAVSILKEHQANCSR